MAHERLFLRLVTVRLSYRRIRPEACFSLIIRIPQGRP